MKRLGMILLAACLAMNGCAAFKRGKEGKDKDQTKPTAGLRLIGRIASVPPDKQFVLIQSYEKWTIEAGTILTTRGEGDRTANLKVTGERMGQFAAADVQSGEVILGDAVYSLHVPKPSAPASETLPNTTGPTDKPSTPDTLPSPPDAEPLPEPPENQSLPPD